MTAPTVTPHECPSCHFARRERDALPETDWPRYEREQVRTPGPCGTCGVDTSWTTGRRLSGADWLRPPRP